MVTRLQIINRKLKDINRKIIENNKDLRDIKRVAKLDRMLRKKFKRKR